MARERPSGGAVVDGKLVYTSVSQIKRFDEREEGGCARRWFFRYVKRLPEPPSAATEKGERIHAQLEHYLKTGEDVLGREARAGKHLLPAPGPDLLIEHRLDGLDAAGVPLIGYVDLTHGRGEYVDDEGQVRPEADPRTREIVDHKSTSNLAYAKTGKMLETDTQMLGYGEWIRRAHALADDVPVRLSHIYYATKGAPNARKSTTVVALKTVKSAWHSKTDPIVEKMKSAASETDAQKIPANPNSCKSFGKVCPYFSQCQQSPLARLSMSLLSKVVTPPAPAAAPTVTNAQGTAVKPAMMGPGGVALYSPQQQASLGVDELGVPRKKLLVEHHEEGILVSPPDAPASNPELAAECDACAGAGKPGQQHRKAECPTLNPPAPKKRGRPAKASPATTPGSGMGSEVPAPALAGGDGSAKAITPPAPSEAVNGGFDLYIDAIPSVPYTTLDRYVAELHEEIIVKGAGLPDFRLVEYGKGAGLLSAAARAAPPSGAVVVFSSPITQPVIEGLVPLARSVVRGVSR